MIRDRKTVLAVVLSAVGLVGTSAHRSSASDDLGKMPVQIVQLYDMTLPSGGIEIELDRDGTIRELEGDISPTLLPHDALVAFHTHWAGAKINGAEREFNAQGGGYEIKFLYEGAQWEVIMRQLEGKWRMVETEREIGRKDAPAGVLAAAHRKIAGGTLKSIELIERGTEREYHVKVELAGASYKCVVSPAGKMLRAVREARAEIEIPLKW